MAHLTSRAPPFRRPLAPESRLQNLPSPPDTDSDFAFHSHPLPPPVLTMPMDSDLPQPRRTSTLAYHNSPLREGRGERAPARSSRWLVVVLPSETLAAHLNSSSGVRSSQGALMPLLPTMYGQLTAVAREFGFPSIVGLCLFLHITEHGFTATPRVSEDTWQILWGHLFDARSPTVSFSQIPVCGRIELEIDLPKARWFDAWVAQRRRAEQPLSVPPSVSHWRGESKTTLLEDQIDDRSEILAPPPPRPRHIPRQLSLLDRLETVSAVSQGQSYGNPRAAPEVELDIPTAVPERDEPLASRVKSWRAGSTIARSPMAATGQVSLDPVHMPNGIPLASPTVPGDEEVELRLEDFQWSVSSDGPGDYESLDTPFEWRRVPSVHLDARLEGSVLLSPTSLATSWGPEYDDDNMGSPVSWSRVSSVDFARRMEGSVALSPSIATSWGPEDDVEYLSIASSPRPFTPHVAERFVHDSPVTPTTATSWGPSSGAPSVASISRPSTPDLALRFASSDIHVPTPSPWVWPFIESSLVNTNHVASLAFPHFQPSHHLDGVASTVFPYFQPQDLVPPSPTVQPGPEVSVLDNSPPTVFSPGVGSLVFPFFQPQSLTEVNSSVSVHHRSQASFALPYIAPEAVLMQVDISLTKRYPDVRPYRAAYPHFEIYPGYVVSPQESVALTVKLQPVYPNLVIYETAYPNFEIYPGNLHKPEVAVESLTVRLPVRYPAFDLYPAAYPNFNIYPSVTLGLPINTPIAPRVGSAFIETMSDNMNPVMYPSFEIYPGNPIHPDDLLSIHSPLVDVTARNLGRYPEFVLYAPTTDLLGASVIGDTLVARYPVISRHPSRYPSFELYPGNICDGSSEEQPSASLPMPSPAVSLARYPAFELYPGNVYGVEPETEVSVVLEARYPAISLYPARYPLFEIYPGYVCSGDVEATISLPAHYPAISSSRTCYPAFELYPGVICDGGMEDSVAQVEVLLKPVYPHFSLYPTQYPFFELYPGLICDGSVKSSADQVEVLLKPVYPHFSLYPTQYPAFELYPGVICDGSLDESAVQVEVMIKAVYPLFSLYPPQYPVFEIYPGNYSDGELDYEQVEIDIVLGASYPHFNLYPAVYPIFSIYPASVQLVHPNESVSPKQHRKTHAILHAEVFGPTVRRARRTHAELHAAVAAKSGLRSPVIIDVPRSPVTRLSNSPNLRQEFSPSPPTMKQTTLRLDTEPRSTDAAMSPRGISPGFATHRLVDIAGSPGPSPTGSSLGHRRTPSTESIGGTRGPRPISSGHRRTASAESGDGGATSGSVRGPRPRHQRTDSTESTDSIDSQTGLPRRREPPPMALRAPTIARRRSVKQTAPPPPPLDESLFSPEDVPEELLPPPVAPRRLSEIVSKTGLPAHPATHRPPPPPPMPPRYPHGLSPVEERPPTALQRSTSLQTQRPSHVRSKGSIDGVPHAPRRRARDSLVMEKAKMFDQGTGGDDQPWTGMRAALSEFPPPPPPPVPALPSVAGPAGRPVSKLDRSKYPFA